MRVRWVMPWILLVTLVAGPGTAMVSARAQRATSPDHIPRNGLLGHWPLNGNAHDTSGNGNDGMIVGATPALGLGGGSFSFDGNDRIVLPNLSFPNSSYTVSIWMNTTNPPEVNDYRMMIDKLDNQAGGPFDLLLGVTSEGRDLGPGFEVWDGGTGLVGLSEPRLKVWDGRWHMVTAAYKDGVQKLFVDGALLKEDDFGGPLPSNHASVTIGGHEGFGPYHHPWIERLDEVVIYDRVLTNLAILRLYQKFAPPPPG